MANTSEEMIRQMYGSQLKSQEETLKSNYEAAASDLDAQKQQNQKAADANLNRTAVEAQKKAASDAEYYAAAGLTSGAKAQAKMARDNQLAADMTAIRTAQQTADAEVERQRGLLAKEYDSAIRKAQADNDLALAQALYQDAEKKEAQLLQQQQNAATMLGASGDFSLHGTAFGMTPEQVAAMQAAYTKAEEEKAAEKAALERQNQQKEQAAIAEFLAAMGDYSGYTGLYGITPEQVAAMQNKYDADQKKQEKEKADAEELAKAEAAAKLMAQAGDFSLYGELYGLSQKEILRLNQLYADENETELVFPSGLDAELIPDKGTYDNGMLSEDEIKQMQNYFGVEADGKWGKQSENAAGGRTAQQAWDYYQALIKANATQPGKPLNYGQSLSGQRPVVQNLVKSLESMDGMKMDQNEIPATIIEYALKNRITMDEAEYLLEYFGYSPRDYIE